MAITLIETSGDSRNINGSVFDIRCHVKKHGDSQGLRTFSFDARSPEAALEWMRMICAATKILALEPHPTIAGGYTSVVCQEQQQEIRRQSIMKKFQTFSVASSSSSLATSDEGSPLPPPPTRPISWGGRGPNFRGRGGRSTQSQQHMSTRSNSTFSPNFLGKEES